MTACCGTKRCPCPGNSRLSKACSGRAETRGSSVNRRIVLRGFTLVELLTALLILSLLALMSYRGLGAALETREHISREMNKWRQMDAFFRRFEGDLRLAAPRPIRVAQGTAGSLPAWRGQAGDTHGASLEFSRFSSAVDTDTARRLGYRLNNSREIELSVWPVLDAAPGTVPKRYPVLAGVSTFDLHYLGPDLVWVAAWPVSATVSTLPQAVRLRIVLTSGEEITRLFATGM